MSVITVNVNFVVDNVSDLTTVPSPNTFVLVKDLKRGGVFKYEPIGFTTDNGVVFPATAIGSGHWVRQIEDTVMLEWYGCVGDGITDDTSNALSAFSSGFNITSRKNKTFLLTEAMQMQPNTTINLNGSKLLFELIGDKKCLQVASGCTVSNCYVVNGLNQAVSQGEFQQPIQIGNYSDSNQYHNIRIENCTIENLRDNGSGITILGDCKNILIENITFPASATLGRLIALHWSADDFYNITQTFHPNNVTIRNIKSGVMSYVGLVNLSGIYISSSVNVKIDSVFIENIEKGDLIRCFCGDYGFQYAQNLVGNDIGMYNISCSNIEGVCTQAIYISMLNTHGPIVKNWLGSFIFDSFSAKGNSPTAGLKRGVDVGQASNIIVKNSTFERFNIGAFAGLNVSDYTLENNVFKDSFLKGFDARFDSKDVSLIRNKFLNSNTSATVGVNGSDVYLEKVQDVNILNNIFDSQSARQHVHLGAGINAPTNVDIVGNKSKNIHPNGIGFSFGASGDRSCLITFQGNSMDFVPTLGVIQGQQHIPFSRTSFRTSGFIVTQYYGSAIPSLGTYNLGDQVIRNVPLPSSNLGWVCTTSGTFGGATNSEGSTDGVSNTITGLTSTSAFFVGDWVTVSLGFPSPTTRYRIVAKTDTSITLNVASNSSQTGVVILAVAPVFKTFGTTGA